MEETLKLKELPSPKSASMCLADLTDEIIDDVATIYDLVADSKLAREFVEQRDPARKLARVLETFGNGNAVEWRFGSKLSRDTKLYIWKGGWEEDKRLIQFAFDPNTAVSDPEGKMATEFATITAAFKQNVDQYLIDHKLNVE